MMTDIWCFTCSHELRWNVATSRHVHVDPDDTRNCPCTDDEEACEP